MAGIICKQCGYENPEGSTICEICAEELSSVENNTDIKPNVENSVNSIIIDEKKENCLDSEEKTFYVICPESQTKTILANKNVNEFYCEGCKKTHTIDGFLWNIESKKSNEDNTYEQASDINNCCYDAVVSYNGNLYLEEVNTHYRIDIDKDGGILGRYGKYGADYFQQNNLLTVSGEHCKISYEYGNWVIRHLSRTNETKYNEMILEYNEPNLLENGKILTLANTISFVVRIN